MNYEKTYTNLVASRKFRSSEFSLDRFVPLARRSGYEIHHILPKCMGGSDAVENLVLLTSREHFLAHWLLHNMHKNERSLSYAFHMMCVTRGDTSSRRYQIAREAYISAMKGRKTKPHSEETKQKIKEGNRRARETKEWKEKNLRSVQKFRDFCKTDNGKKMFEKQAASRCKYMFPIVQKTLKGEFVKEWENMLEIRKVYPGWSSNISACLRGKRKYAHDFIWVKLIKTQ